jgi:heptaprenyl diphosphate synthase
VRTLGATPGPTGSAVRPMGTARIARLGLLLAAGLALHAVESLVPSPFPFVRVGLANIATLIALFYLGFGDALLITVLRVILASLIVGTFAGPAFALSMAGGLAAVLGMGLAARLAAPPLSVVGVSVVGAACHNIAQISVLGALYTGAGAAFRLLPAALLLAAAAGVITGLVALFVLEKLDLLGHNGLSESFAGYSAGARDAEAVVIEEERP